MTQTKTRTGDFKAQAQVFKALAHPARLLMVEELSRGERCVCELAALVGSEMPTVSRHLAYLHRASLVETWEEGTWNHYRLATPSSRLHQTLLSCVTLCPALNCKVSRSSACAARGKRPNTRSGTGRSVRCELKSGPPFSV